MLPHKLRVRLSGLVIYPNALRHEPNAPSKHLGWGTALFEHTNMENYYIINRYLITEKMLEDYHGKQGRKRSATWPPGL